MTKSRALFLTIAAIALHAQPALKFEVAAIRSHPPAAPRNLGNGKMAPVGPKFSLSGPRLTIENASLPDLIEFAYALDTDDVSGTPHWANSLRFDINAKAQDSRRPTKSEFRQMLQSLLTDRFRLKFHVDTKPARGFSLVIAKSGPKLRKSAPGAEPSMRIISPAHSVEMTVTKWTMDQLASQLSMPGQPEVVNRTGLAGTYDFKLRWMPDQYPDLDPTAPSLSTALLEQLGLKLEPRNSSTRTLVIDSAEHPSED